jgi:hypothetical protein
VRFELVERIKLQIKQEFLMFRRILQSRLLVVLLVLGALSVTAVADTHSPRQYYGSWRRHNNYNYYYRPYYFKPSSNFSGYKYHYAIYYPSRPNYYYFYNPHNKTFWGRCPVNTNGKPQYSLLDEKDRKEKISDIPESAFPPPGALPPIPESKDGVTLELPPNDLPIFDAPPTP